MEVGSSWFIAQSRNILSELLRTILLLIVWSLFGIMYD